jgi:RNA polymerase sigma-70 factor (ECF subfamily)
VRDATGGASDFASAYRDLFLPAMRLVHRMTGDRALAEDMAAEALARAYARWDSVSRLDSPQAWVLRVTTNLTIDAVRRQKLAMQALPALVVPETTSRFDDDVAARIALVAALGALPRRQREAIALRYLAGLSEEEVSRSLDITPSSVRTHLQRGLASLRRHLGHQGVPRVAL